jgi:hypothetical protein
MPSAPFLALITPLAPPVTQPPVGPPSGPVDPGYGIPETGWNRPTHPIMLPGMPGWGVGPGSPTPPGYWGPNDPRPTNPIAEPPWGFGGRPPGAGQPPLGFWGPNDPRPTNPIAQPPGGWGGGGGIVLPPLPPGVTPPLPPGSKPPVTPIPPGEVPAHPATGVLNVYLWIPYVGVVGPIYVPIESVPPGAPAVPPVPPA